MKPEVPDSLEAALYPSDSIHQQAIEAHFGPDLLRELTTVERDWLASLDLFFVVFTNRSGSTLLTEVLHQMGAGIHPRAEPFNKDAVTRLSEKQGHKTFIDYLLRRVRAYAQDGRAGFKINVNQLFWVTRLGLHNLFRSVRIINSVRLDPLDQAVSHVKAKSSGQWTSLMKIRHETPLEYSRSDIARSLLRVTTQRQLFDYYCALHRPRYLSVVYEEFLSDTETQISRLADFLGMDSVDPASISLDDVAIAPQRDETNARLKAQFQADFDLR